MATYDKETGQLIEGIDEVFQGLATILTTPKKSRVMRRNFGSDVPRMVDKPMSPLTLIDWFAAIAEAVKAEPRFKLANSKLAPESNINEGQGIFDVSGLYYPRGHLGDYSEVYSVTKRLVVPVDQAI